MTDEITETGYTEGSYGLFGIAVFTVCPARVITWRIQLCGFESIRKGKTAILHLCFGTVKNRRLGSKKTRYIRAFRRRLLFCLRIML